MEIDKREQRKKEEQIQEQEAKDYYGAVDYSFIKLDQPRGWKGFLLKGSAYGLIMWSVFKIADVAANTVKNKKEGKLITMPTNNKKSL